MVEDMIVFAEHGEEAKSDAVTLLYVSDGEAVISFLEEDGTPGIAQKTRVLPPQSRMGAVTDEERERSIRESLLYSKYANAVDPDSAYEILERLGIEKQEALEKAKAELGKAMAFTGCRDLRSMDRTIIHRG